ncbi:MAG: 50S ribosomal protein L30 [Bacteroidales bacterium]|jgi:large subunit ribosomal protein L30|nr:50S ribosomal protein L30 [Bacteroidales bacterium]MBR3578225.1 50S ribosomal protein L30 [Bacteroidales bacterium]MBR4488073.1 50S ribosomal protein L30 [Bacteroidales bacterium]
MKKLRITQVKSSIDRSQRQKRSLEALGLKKMHQTVEHEGTPQILGIVEKVKHLVTVEEI